jgi:hypothetical protein
MVCNQVWRAMQWRVVLMHVNNTVCRTCSCFRIVKTMSSHSVRNNFVKCRGML